MLLYAILLLLVSALPGAGAPRDRFTRVGTVRNETVSLPALEPAVAYRLQFSIDPVTAFGENSRIVVTVSQAATTLVHKTLHAGDPDCYAVFHAAVRGPARVTLSVASPLSRPAHFRLEVKRRNETTKPEGGSRTASGNARIASAK